MKGSAAKRRTSWGRRLGGRRVVRVVRGANWAVAGRGGWREEGRRGMMDSRGEVWLGVRTGELRLCLVCGVGGGEGGEGER